MDAKIREYFEYEFELFKEKTLVELIMNDGSLFTTKNSDEGYFLRILKNNRIGYFTSSGSLNNYNILNIIKDIPMVPNGKNIQFSKDNYYENLETEYNISINNIYEYISTLLPLNRYNFHVKLINKRMNIVTLNSHITNYVKFIQIFILDRENNIELFLNTKENYKDDVKKYLLYKIINKKYNFNKYNNIEISGQAYGFLIKMLIRQNLLIDNFNLVFAKDIYIYDDGEQEMLTNYSVFDYEGIKRRKTNIIYTGKFHNNLNNISRAKTNKLSGNAYREHYHYLPKINTNCITQIINKEKISDFSNNNIKIEKFLENYSTFNIYTGEYLGKCLINLPLQKSLNEYIIVDVSFNLYNIINNIESYGFKTICNINCTNMPSILVSTKLLELYQS